MTRFFETKNVVMWLGNDPDLYANLRRYVAMAKTPNYVQFIWGMKLENSKTPDGVAWISDCLDYQDLNDFVVEIGGA